MRGRDNRATGPSWTVSSYGYVNFMFRSYHWREWSTPLDGAVSLIWDDFNDVEAFETAELSESMITKIFQAKLAHFGFEGMDVPNPFAGSSTDPVWKNGCLYSVNMPVKDLKDRLADFIAWVGEQASSVGGDDAYFDYYPDLWTVVWQLVDIGEAILNTREIRDLAEFSLQVAVNTRYFDHIDPNDLTSESYSVLPGYTEANGQIRQSMVKRGYLTQEGKMTEKGLAWIVSHTFTELSR